MTIETDRLVAAEPASTQDEQLDRAIRPRTLDEYLGQRVVREQMEIFLAAAKKRGEPLDHTLIFGPPGLGKDDARKYYRSRDGRVTQNDQRPDPGESGGHCRPDD